jgi:hypothetical protein
LADSLLEGGISEDGPAPSALLLWAMLLLAVWAATKAEISSMFSSSLSLPLPLSDSEIILISVSTIFYLRDNDLCY